MPSFISVNLRAANCWGWFLRGTLGARRAQWNNGDEIALRSGSAPPTARAASQRRRALATASGSATTVELLCLLRLSGGTFSQISKHFEYHDCAFFQCSRLILPLRPAACRDSISPRP